MILPVPYQVLSVIRIQIENNPSVFEPESSSFLQLREFLQPGFEIDSIADAPYELRHYLHTLLLAAMVMHKGVLMPEINNLNFKNGEISIRWASGLSESFKIGVWDEAGFQFASRVFMRLFGNSKLPSTVRHMVNPIYSILGQYQQTLLTLSERLSKLGESPDHLIAVFSQKFDPDLLFTLLAAFPSEHLNSFFLYLHSFFPPDLTFKGSDGRNKRVSDYFQQSTQDVHVLIQKVRVYSDLYFADKQPIVHHITQTKTKDFIQDNAHHPMFWTGLQENLQSLDKLQIQPRLGLMSLFLRHGHKVVNA